MTIAELVEDNDVRSEGKGVELEDANKWMSWIWRKEETDVWPCSPRLVCWLKKGYRWWVRNALKHLFEGWLFT